MGGSAAPKWCGNLGESPYLHEPQCLHQEDKVLPILEIPLLLSFFFFFLLHACGAEMHAPCALGTAAKSCLWSLVCVFPLGA